MEKPDVDQIDGLSPAISIDQKGASRNPRSTVGTVTEIYDYLRLLFARIGVPHCPNGHVIERQSVQQIVDQVLALPEGTRLLVLGPLVKDRKTEGDRVFEAARRQGFVRVRVDGEMYDLGDAPTLDRYKRHSIEVVVDRYVVRRAEAPDGTALASGRAADRSGDRRSAARSRRRAPGRSDRDRAAPRRGARADRAGAARGRGARFRGAPLQRALLVPIRRLHDGGAGAAQLLVQLATRRRLPELHRARHAARHRTRPGDPRPLEEHPDGALVPWAKMPTDASWRLKILEAICEAHGWDFRAPIRDLPPEAVKYLLYADKDERVVVRYRHERGENTYNATFEGVITNLDRRFRETDSDFVRSELEKYMVSKPCPTCGGKRLRPEILSVTIGDGTSGTSRRCRSRTRSAG